MEEWIEWDDRKDDNDLFFTTLNKNSNELTNIEYCKTPDEAIKSNTTKRIAKIVESKNNSLNWLNDFLEDFNSQKPLSIQEIEKLIIYLQEPQTIEALNEIAKKLKFVYSQENKVLY